MLFRSVNSSEWTPQVQVLSPLPGERSFAYVKHGESGGKRMVFVFFPPSCDRVHLRFRDEFFKTNQVKDIIAGRDLTVSTTQQGQECLIPATRWRFSVLVES